MALDPEGDYADAALELLVTALRDVHGKKLDEDVARENLGPVLGEIEAMVRAMVADVVPTGGSSDQVLTKVTGADYNTAWETP